MFDMTRNHGCPRNEIMIVHSIENFVSIFYPTTLDVRIDEAGVHKDIIFITIL
jgi:hypothetical protein